ncbi:MAG TPA: envelope stress response membrane protein PspB [Allosphingosinicella sp.]
MEGEVFIVLLVVGVLGILFVALPWLIFHYITRWKTAATLTNEDEKLMEELYDLARRLDDRMCSIERIMTAENPNWRAVACDPASTGIEDLNVRNQAAGRIGQ